ncbi:hypothetical protein ACF0H5_012194 [Mactra antiquata]
MAGFRRRNAEKRVGDSVGSKVFRKVKLPQEYTGINFSTDYCSNLYPSSKWVTEKQDNFADRKTANFRTKPDFEITSLDSRKHNPQPTQIFHIKRINQKPVCNVQSWVSTGGPQEPKKPDDSMYTVSYTDRPTTEPLHIVHKDEKEKPIEGIVPINISGSHFDVRSEMMLPMCDSTSLPSARNPHRYLLRKRKVPPPFNTFDSRNVKQVTTGIVYPNLEHPRMTSFPPGEAQVGTLPFPNEVTETRTPTLPSATPERISISSLSGMNFSRRKFIEPPSGHIFCGFDGGVAEITSSKFDDKYLPFIRAKTVI